MDRLIAYQTHLLRLLTLLALSTSLFLSTAEGKDAKPLTAEPSFFDYLQADSSPLGEITRFTLTFDHQQMVDLKYTKDYFPATFSYDGENWDAKLRIRGRYRRRVCDFPPLRVKLSKSMLRAAGLQGHNKFKLVTHCSDAFDNRNNILREQLSYELYHLITGQGFRTKLVEVTYHDTSTGETFQRLGILIEDKDEMATAHAGEDCDQCSYLPVNGFVRGNPETVALFNYMIGNADWSAINQRNVKVVQQHAGGQYLLVPYDFDFAALVDVEYAVPNPDYDQVHIKDRVWIWGYDSAPTQLADVIAHYQCKEAAIMAYVDSYPGLDKRSRRQVSKYLASFFEELNSGKFQAGI